MLKALILVAAITTLATAVSKPKMKHRGFDGGWGLKFGLTLGETGGVVHLAKHQVNLTWPFAIKIFGLSKGQRKKEDADFHDRMKGTK